MLKRTLSALVVAVAIIANPAAGATITFDPASDNSVVPGDLIVADLTLNLTDLPYFDEAYIYVGSDDIADISFVVATEWDTAMGEVQGPTYDSGTTSFAESVFVGGRFNSMPFGQTSLAVGTMTVDTTGMLEGDYTVDVDAGVSEVVFTDESTLRRPIDGTFSFHIVPEPGTLSLLALAGVAVVRRRR